MPHLWEVDHPYYCNQGNYYSTESVETAYRSWAEFAADNADADFDMNLVFRFDWREGEDGECGAFNGDVSYRNGELLVFWMGQRKGLFRYSRIEVCRADEPSVIEFLRPRWDHMRKLWEPIADDATTI